MRNNLTKLHDKTRQLNFMTRNKKEKRFLVNLDTEIKINDKN